MVLVLGMVLNLVILFGLLIHLILMWVERR